MLCYCHHIRSRIGYGRATGFRDYSNRKALLQRTEVRCILVLICVFAHRVEGATVYVKSGIHTAKESSGGTNLFHYKMTYLTDYLTIIGWKYLLVRRVAESDGNKVQGRIHRPSIYTSQNRL